MIDQSQTCPSCRSSKYTNPQLKLMVNVCGHSLCENCVEVLFVRGSGLCAQCKTPIRKTNFRYQLFEDPLVQKEVDIRKKILSDFNKREDDFETVEDYDLYLEKIEEIIYNLTNDVNAEETKRYIENYKRENKDLIKRNRLKPSASLAFYEAELEREAMLREQREREELEEQPSESKKPRDSQGLSANGIDDEKRKSAVTPTALPVTTNTPQLAFGRRPPPTNSGSTFVPPSMEPSRSYLVPPTGFAPSTSFNRPFAHAPTSSLGGFAVPPSMFPLAPPSASFTGGWISGAHNIVHIPSGTVTRKQPDTVLIPSRQTAHNSTRNQEVSDKYITNQLYEVELCGPIPPLSRNQHMRWPEILNLYENTVITKLQNSAFNLNKVEYYSPRDIKSKCESVSSMKEEEQGLLSVGKENELQQDNKSDVKVAVLFKQENSDLQIESNQLMNNHNNNDINVNQKKLLGLSHRLPSGACGISPSVFLERCLEESRYGLFI